MSMPFWSDTSHFQRMLEDSPDCLVGLDLDGRVRFMNRAARRFLGIDRLEDAAGRSWASFWPEPAQPLAQTALQAARRGQPHRFNVEVPTPDGASVWRDVVVSLNRDADGAETGFTVACRDSTEWMTALGESEARATRLTKTTDALVAVSRLTQLGGWEYDCIARRVAFSSELISLIGAQPDQARDEALDMLVDEDRARFEQLLDHAVEQGRELAFEGRLRGVDGAIQWVRIVGEPHMVDGRCVTMRGATQDMTEAHLASERLVASEQTARQSAQAMSDFLANMSHEIRTPLNGVLGMAQAMGQSQLAPAQRQRLEVVQRSGEALLALLDDLLDQTKIASGKVELEPGVIDLAALARDIEVFAPVAESKNVDFMVAVSPQTGGQCAGDPKRVRQVLNNLVANAVKFTERGAIGVEIRHEAERLMLRVRDSGVGIPADKLDRVFDRFVQVYASATRRFGGSGLGLAICRDLVALMGGEISVDSIERVGTTFTVSLPSAVVEAAPEPDPAYDLDDDALDEPSNLRVLAAEDNPMNQLVLKTLLAGVGIEPVMVANGAEALKAWRSGDWDLVLMDIQMPVMDGISATRAMRRLEREEGLAHTPVIAVTANAMPHHQAEYIAAGMDHFVAKPVNLATLLHAMDAAMSQPAVV